MPRRVLIVVLALLVGPCFAHAKTVRMIMQLGQQYDNVDVRLYDSTPITQANFLGYVNGGRYDYTMIHRSVSVNRGGIGIVQGGGIAYTSQGLMYVAGDNDPNIANEFSPDRPNVYGTIAMAKKQRHRTAQITVVFQHGRQSRSGRLRQLLRGLRGCRGQHGCGGTGLRLLNVYDLTGGDPYSPYGSLPTLIRIQMPTITAASLPRRPTGLGLAAYLLTDANNDGVVDAADYIAMKETWV